MPCAPRSTCPVAHPTLRLSCCQVEVHPYFRNDALLGWCRGQGIHVTAYAPLGSPDSESIFPRKRPLVLMQDEAVRAVAERTGKNVGQARTRSSSWEVVGRISRQGPCVCMPSEELVGTAPRTCSYDPGLCPLCWRRC